MPGLAFAEWRETHWVLQQLWRIDPVWRPKEWSEDSPEDQLPVRPAEKPFWLEDFDGDKIPEVVVAGEVQKYYQEHYLFRFDRRHRRLALVGESMAAPVRVDGYVRLYTKSPRRAIFEEWTYLHWRGEKLLPVARWHDEVPYEDPEKSFVQATRWNSKGEQSLQCVIREADSDDGARYRISASQGNAEIAFHWKPGQQPPAEDGLLQAYLFEKTIGLPRRLYPVNSSEETQPKQKLEDLATVEVKGAKALVKMLR